MRNIVLITGGTSGIGLALAEAFIGQGASVAICARSQAALDTFRIEHPQALTLERWTLPSRNDTGFATTNNCVDREATAAQSFSKGYATTRQCSVVRCFLVTRRCL